jgi:rubrerythrin
VSLFKKMKAGASKAADVAQQTVEVTKVVAKIAGKRREIEKNINLAGQHMYEAYKAGDLKTAEDKVKELCQWNVSLESEIAALEVQVKRLRHEKVCVCGYTAAGGAKFCPSCGKPLQAHREVITIDVEPEKDK